MSIYYLLYNKEFLASLWSIHCYGALKLPPPKTAATGRIAAHRTKIGHILLRVHSLVAQPTLIAAQNEQNTKKRKTQLAC